MARRKLIREVAEVSGAIKRNPQRYRNEVPKSPYSLGLPPDYMTEAAKKCWFEIESYALAGVLGSADRMILELAANLLAEYRENPAEFVTARLTALINSLGRMGLTPADRQKLGPEKAKEANPFDDF